MFARIKKFFKEEALRPEDLQSRIMDIQLFYTDATLKLIEPTLQLAVDYNDHLLELARVKGTLKINKASYLYSDRYTYIHDIASVRFVKEILQLELTGQETRNGKKVLQKIVEFSNLIREYQALPKSTRTQTETNVTRVETRDGRRKVVEQTEKIDVDVQLKPPANVTPAPAT